MLLQKIPVGLGVAGQALVVVAEDVIGEEELRVAAGAGPEGHEEELCLGGQVRGRHLQYACPCGRTRWGAF